MNKIRKAFEAGFDAGAEDAESGIIICEDFKREVLDAAWEQYKLTDAQQDRLKVCDRSHKKRGRYVLS